MNLLRVNLCLCTSNRFFENQPNELISSQLQE